MLEELQLTCTRTYVLHGRLWVTESDGAAADGYMVDSHCNVNRAGSGR